jgi:hypothetical protein
LKLARVLVRFNHIASIHRKRESRHHVSGCRTSRSRLRLVSSEDRLNARSLKNFPAPTVRFDFNQRHRAGHFIQSLSIWGAE